VAPTVSSSTRRGSGTAQAGDEYRKMHVEEPRHGEGKIQKKNKKNKADERHYANARKKKKKKQSQTILK
jgi:hypothetical protein